MAGRLRTYVAQERAGVDREWDSTTERPWLASLAATLTWLAVVSGVLGEVVLLVTDATGGAKVLGTMGIALVTAVLVTIFAFIDYAVQAFDELLRRIPPDR